MSKLDERATNTYRYLLLKYDNQCDELDALSDETDRLTYVLKTKGEGEISMSNGVFPKIFLEIKNLQRIIQNQMTGSFYVKNRTFHHNK